MSYILDALKNSDRIRDRGKVPDLQSQPFVSAEVHGRKSVPILFAAVSVIVLVLISAGLASLVNEHTEGIPASIEVAPQKAQITQASPIINDHKLKIPLPVNVSEPPLRTDDWLLPSESLSDVKGIKITVDTSMTDVSQADRRARMLAGQQPAINKPSPPPIPRNRLALATKPLPVVPKAPKPAAQQLQATPYSGIPHQKQLSLKLQRQLPELAFTVHVYSDSPVSRMVKINGRRVQEGGHIDKSLKLLEITKDGVILQFGSNRYWRRVH